MSYARNPVIVGFKMVRGLILGLFALVAASSVSAQQLDKPFMGIGPTVIPVGKRVVFLIDTSLSMQLQFSNVLSGEKSDLAPELPANSRIAYALACLNEFFKKVRSEQEATGVGLTSCRIITFDYEATPLAANLSDFSEDNCLVVIRAIANRYLDTRERAIAATVVADGIEAALRNRVDDVVLITDGFPMYPRYSLGEARELEWRTSPTKVFPTAANLLRRAFSELVSAWINDGQTYTLGSIDWDGLDQDLPLVKVFKQVAWERMKRIGGLDKETILTLGHQIAILGHNVIHAEHTLIRAEAAYADYHLRTDLSSRIRSVHLNEDYRETGRSWNRFFPELRGIFADGSSTHYGSDILPDANGRPRLRWEIIQQ